MNVVPYLYISSLLVVFVKVLEVGSGRDVQIEVLTSWMAKLVRKGEVLRDDEVARRLVAMLLMCWSTCFPTGTVSIKAMTARANPTSGCKVTRICG
ncbi:MAG: hypothetical protein QOK06_3327 [Acidimicrobiaceae bacterium]